MNSSISPVALEKAYRLLNHGPTVLVSASHEGVDIDAPAISNATCRPTDELRLHRIGVQPLWPAYFSFC
jgi:hypothetical protein